jgi:hypothetical protein
MVPTQKQKFPPQFILDGVVIAIECAATPSIKFNQRQISFSLEDK